MRSNKSVMFSALVRITFFIKSVCAYFSNNSPFMFSRGNGQFGTSCRVRKNYSFFIVILQKNPKHFSIFRNFQESLENFKVFQNFVNFSGIFQYFLILFVIFLEYKKRQSKYIEILTNFTNYKNFQEIQKISFLENNY